MKKALAACFLVGVLGLAATLIWVREKPAALTKVAAPAPADTNRLHEASWYDKLPDGMVHCRLCPNSCRLPEGALGLCPMDAAVMPLPSEETTPPVMKIKCAMRSPAGFNPEQ